MLNAVPYKKPTLLGGKDIIEFIDKKVDLDKNRIYVGFYFIKPGRQFYVIRHQGKAYAYKELVKCLEEEIPPCKFLKFVSF